jgi:replicative DNA helicase
MKQENRKKSATSNAETGRIMPQAREFEEAVLGAVLLEKTAFETAGGILSPEMFYDTGNGLIFAACAALEADRKPVDVLTVAEQLRKTEKLEEAGGIARIAGLLANVVSSAHLEYHSLIVKDRYLKRRIIGACSAGMALGFDETEEADEIVAGLNTEIERLQEDIVGKRETGHLSEAVEKSVVQMHVRIANRREGITPGIPTGFVELDRLINGWQPEKLVILAARPGAGKTAIAIKLARKAAMHGTPVAFFSLEMGETELADRMIIAEAGISADNYASGALKPAEWSMAETAASKISPFPVYIDDNPGVTVRNIVNRARMLKKQGKCGMVIIDYLQLITPVAGTGQNRNQEVGEMSRQLKIHAKALKIPFIVLCQMNRNIESEKREPNLSDLRESGSIEQDADIVIFISRPGMYVDELRDKKTGEPIENCIELLVKKNRSGKPGKVRIKHNDSMTDFYDWDWRGQARQLPPLPQREIKNYYETDNTPF